MFRALDKPENQWQSPLCCNTFRKMALISGLSLKFCILARLCGISFLKHIALIINNINKTQANKRTIMRTLGGNNYDIMRLSILTLALAAALQTNAQTDGNQTILTIDNKNISREEFQRLYMKNNTEVTFDSASLAEYMRLFIDYKLKVIEAEGLGMDTTPEFIREFSDYCAQLEKPYLTDASVDDSLAREAYEHMKWDVRASHILIKCSENASAADTLKAYKRAQDIRKRALKEDFNKLARETSEDPSAVRNGGDLGYRWAVMKDDTNPNKELQQLFTFFRKGEHGSDVLVEGERLRVVVRAIDERAYDYLYSMQQMENTNTNPIDNFTGGCLGYFSAYSEIAFYQDFYYNDVVEDEEK